MEIYKDLSNPASKEFEKLLNNQFTKNTIEEGKVIEGKINKITEKFVFLFIEGLKSEPVLDINELKSMGLLKNIAIGETISVLLEKIEDKLRELNDEDTLVMVGRLIEDLIEDDMEAEKAFRKEVKEFIDKTIEERVVEEAMYSGSIAQA